VLRLCNARHINRDTGLPLLDRLWEPYVVQADGYGQATSFGKDPVFQDGV
jgi:hypothetical protein